MKSRDELAREVEVLGKRIATLSAAVLRLGSSLDLATTVLQEATDSARTLTNARAHRQVRRVAYESPYSGIRLILGRPMHGYRESASLQHVA